MASGLSFPTFGSSFFWPLPKSPATLLKSPLLALIFPGSFLTVVSSRTTGLDSSSGSSAQASSPSNSLLCFSGTEGILKLPICFRNASPRSKVGVSGPFLIGELSSSRAALSSFFLEGCSVLSEISGSGSSSSTSLSSSMN